MYPEGKDRLAVYAVLGIVVILLYANTLAGGFVWDDNLFTANQVYWSFDFRKIFLSLANGLEYQPVRDLSYLFDISVWGGSPFGFHLTNLLLFAVITLLAYKTAESFSCFTRRAEDKSPSWFVPFFTALIFAVHPLKSEVVAWITQRNTLLATLFFLLSLLLFRRYLERDGLKIYILSFLAFSLALLSKATVVILPLLLFCMLLKNGGEWRQRKFWLPLAPFIALSGAGAMLHIMIARKTAVVSAAYYGSFQERLVVALQIPFFYLKKSLLPTDISAFYADNFSLSLSSPRVLISAATLIGVTAAAWFLRKRNPEILIGCGWFVITLLPVSNLLATSPVAADRYLFLPSFGLAFTAATLLSRIRLPLKLMLPIALLGVSLLVPLTLSQNRVWHDDIALWSHTAVRSPQVAGVWFNLGRAWHKTTQLSKALDAYLRAVKLDPADIKSLDNAATIFPSSRGSITARHELVKSLAEQLPPAPAGISLTGYTDAEWKHPDAAEELFLYLLAADSQSTTLKLALANLYRKLGAFDRATAIYSEIVRNGSGKGEAEFGLAVIAAINGNNEEKTRLLAIAQNKGGVPQELLSKVEPLAALCQAIKAKGGDPVDCKDKTYPTGQGGRLSR